MFVNASAENIEVSNSWDRCALEDIKKLAEYPVALIGDVQQRMGMMASYIRPVTTIANFFGNILPVLTREGDNLAIHRALDEALPGDVLVINGNGDSTRALLGDLLGEICKVKGIAGVVVDGSVRDIEELNNMGLPVFARSISPVGPYKYGPGTVGAAVACANIVCYPGDAIIADYDGVVVVPRIKLAERLYAVRGQDAMESGLRTLIRASALPS